MKIDTGNMKKIVRLIKKLSPTTHMFSLSQIKRDYKNMHYSYGDNKNNLQKVICFKFKFVPVL